MLVYKNIIELVLWPDGITSELSYIVYGLPLKITLKRVNTQIERSNCECLLILGLLVKRWKGIDVRI